MDLLFLFVFCLSIHFSTSNARFHFDHKRGSYSLPVATNYLFYAYSSYCPPSALQDWSCFWCQNTVENFTVTQIFYDEFTNTFGFAGYNNREILVSFRGTRESSLDNWITDLNSMALVDFPIGGQNAKVADGFYSAYTALRDQIRKAVQILQTSFPTFPIVLVGHSLGGALSSMCAVDLAAQMNGSFIIHYSFGSPRIGNEDFINYYSQLIPITWRTVNKRDVVPHLPMMMFGFRHTPIEVWFENSYTQFQVCNGSGEDPSCSDSVVFTNTADHLLYLGYYEGDGSSFGC